MKKISTLWIAMAVILFCLGQVLLPSSLIPVSKTQSIQHEQISEYLDQGERARLRGDYEKAIELYRKSLSLAREYKDQRAEVESLAKLGLLYWNQGEPEQSVAFYQKARTAAQKAVFTEKAEELDNYLLISGFYQDGKHYRDEPSQIDLARSVESFEKAIGLAREIQSREHELKCLRQLSMTYLESGLYDIERFFSLNTSALEIAIQINHRKEEGRCLLNIGYHHSAVEDYSQALSHYTDALKIARELEDYDNQSICLNNISNIYRNLGDYDKALENLKEALRIDREELEDDLYVAIDLNNIGVTYQKKALHSGNPEDLHNALANYEESVKIARRIKETETEIQALNNIGLIYVDLEQFSKALDTFQQALEKAEDIQDLEETARILNNIGIAHAKQENFDLSVENLLKALDIASRLGREELLWEAYFEIGNAYMQKGDYQDALQNYKNSIDHLENIRSRIVLEELRASYLGTDKRLEAYQNMVDLQFELSRLEPEKSYDSEAFHILERGKARTFLDRLEASQVNIAQGVDSQLLDQEDRLMKDISSLNTELFRPDLSPDQEKDIRDRLTQYEEQLESLKRKIRMASPAYVNLKYPQIISLEEAQDQMAGPKTAFIEYSLGEKNSYMFVITKRELNILPLPPAGKIRAMVKDYLRTIADKDTRDFSLGHELYKILVSPGLNCKFDTIIFIPDDILHHLPFETLISQEDSQRWLIRDYKIAYAPSITSLREIIQRKEAQDRKARKDLLAFGDPYFGPEEEKIGTEESLKTVPSADKPLFSRLEYSGLEIDKIASLFKARSTDIYTREMATEERLKELDLEPYKILHFATHCIIDDTKPARSHIVFSVGQPSTEDEILQMREIFNLRLNSDLVTLSACQTGLGQLIRGEGIVGLSRAFFHAGASSAIISLWAVHDQATAQFMERCYTHLRSSKSIMDAIQKTKLEMIESGVLSHPYYWAGFVVTGDSGKVIYASVFKKVILGAALLLVVGIICFLIFRKRSRKAI